MKIFTTVALVLLIFAMQPFPAGAVPPERPKLAAAAAAGEDLLELDTSSVSAFSRELRKHYAISLKDNNSYLSGIGGKKMMDEISLCLSLFSPEFIKKMVDYYSKEHSSFFTLEIVKPSNSYYAYVEWGTNIKICLAYNSNNERNGVKASVLAHELGHMVHFISEDYMRKARIKLDLMEINGKFNYVGDKYRRDWNEYRHGTTFVRSYSLYSHYEDVATIFEELVGDPESMQERLNDPLNASLRKKVEYIRDMTYNCISDECSALFAPLEEDDSAYWKIESLPKAS